VACPSSGKKSGYATADGSQIEKYGCSYTPENSELMYKKIPKGGTINLWCNGMMQKNHKITAKKRKKKVRQYLKNYKKRI